MKTATFRIGGRDYVVRPLTFRQMHENWADIQSLGASTDVFDTIRASLAIIARLVAVDRPEVEPGNLATVLEDELMAQEAFALDREFSTLLKISGLVAEGGVPGTGEAGAAGASQ